MIFTKFIVHTKLMALGTNFLLLGGYDPVPDRLD